MSIIISIKKEDNLHNLPQFDLLVHKTISFNVENRK